MSGTDRTGTDRTPSIHEWHLERIRPNDEWHRPNANAQIIRIGNDGWHHPNRLAFAGVALPEKEYFLMKVCNADLRG
jgi:hypothetical protein